MLIGLIAAGTLAGLVAGLSALVAGAGILTALAVYAGTGAGLVVLLALLAALPFPRHAAAEPATSS